MFLCLSGSGAAVVDMKHEREALEQKVTSLQKQIELLENSKKRTEEHGQKVSAQLNELSDKLVTTYVTL